MPEAVIHPDAQGGEPAALDLTAARFSDLLEEAAKLPTVPVQALASLREKVAAHAFNLVVAGEFKRGKSSVVNALLGAELLPTGVIPLTSVVARLAYGERPAASIVFENAEVRPAALTELADYATERGNPRNAKGVREVAVNYPTPWLKGGIQLVDTPGIGSIHAHNTAVTYGYLPQADAVIFVASVDQHLLRLLAEVRLSAELERKALAAPLDELDAKLGAFAQKKAETVQTKLDFDAGGGRPPAGQGTDRGRLGGLQGPPRAGHQHRARRLVSGAPRPRRRCLAARARRTADHRGA